ncbi:MAG TPA: hypothetical protein PLO41_04060 [Rubrivivax sp.]|nr:hypothetical protein [Rubrivivax sp.]
MFFALPTAGPNDATRASQGSSDLTQPGTIETRLWLDEHEWLYDVLRSEHNASPTFRFPDLISACVSLVFLHADAPARIFDFLGTQLVLRPPLTPRRRESMWLPQFELLLAVQRSPANRHPNPKFQLDQLTTACVALCRQFGDADALVLRQARLNMADRSARWRGPRSG